MDKLKIILGISALLFNSAINAAIISIDDSVFGIDSITKDTESGLEWLDITLSVNRSYSDVSSQFGAGGDYEGWKYSTVSQLDDFVVNALGLPKRKVTNHFFIHDIDSYVENKIDKLVLMIGDTLNISSLYYNGVGIDEFYGYEKNSNIARHATYGMIDGLPFRNYVMALQDWDETGINGPSDDLYRAEYIDLGVNGSQGVGSFLVRDIRNVPEPSILTLMGLGILGISLVRRRNQP